MVTDTFTTIFKNGSTTYFYSSIFFPKEIKTDVFILYSFVRTADNFVDAIPQQKKEFYKFREDYELALKGGNVDDEIIDAFISLMKRKQFDKKWVDAFLDAMEQDLSKKTYKTLKETEKYMYGSAEVIGLFMAKIMNLPTASFTSARYLGKAMQLINFIRDVEEDNQLGRTYLPVDEMRSLGLKGVRNKDAVANPEAFSQFITQQITLYHQWQNEAEKGYHFIPHRFLIPIRTASDMYAYTASQIQKNPFIVYERKVKPNKFRILATGIKNSFAMYG